jgi:uncharacterized repeat protein (TIGR03803 family)
MNYRRFLGAASAALMIVIVISLALTPGAWAQGKFKTLYTFTGGNDGAMPWAGLIFDRAGNLYGTTEAGGNSNSSYCWSDYDQSCGTVFKLSPHPDGTWSKSVLYSFCSLTNCADGENPAAGLIFDQAGNLYGVATSVVFKLAPNNDGTWAESVLSSATDYVDYPQGGLIFDQAGNLYGTTMVGGGCGWTSAGCGTVFELTPNQDGTWTNTVLYNFGGDTDGFWPIAGLILDQAGNLYGTTWWGGLGGHICGGNRTHECGTVFELTLNSNGSWTEKVLQRFHSINGYEPSAGLIFDAAGNLYGTTGSGGHRYRGVAFKLTPNADGSWKEKLLHSFSGGSDGAGLSAGLIFDTAGNLYGTAGAGGNLSVCNGRGCGVVFKLSPNSNGGWHETVLHAFLDSPGARPVAGLIFDASENLYGTTAGDGTTTFGTVFEITQ